jgi:hypothetical protein
VWLAEDTKLDGRQVAIKMLPAVLVANKRAIQQLKAEAKVAIQLAHPNIATLRAFEESEEGPFLVMDYIKGQTLEDLLADRGTLSEDEIVRLFTPVAQALDYAHKLRIVHRDIKPSNILIRDDGIPLLTDFGIARELKDSMTRVTGRSTSGTLPYMAPEQVKGEPPSPAQDIYSLAATMYECIAGRPPFHRGQIEHQILNEPAPPISVEYGSCSSWIMAALDKEPSRRPSSAASLVLPHGDLPARQGIPLRSGRWVPLLLWQITLGFGPIHLHKHWLLCMLFPICVIWGVLSAIVSIDPPYRTDAFWIASFLVCLAGHILNTVCIPWLQRRESADRSSFYSGLATLVLGQMWLGLGPHFARDKYRYRILSSLAALCTVAPILFMGWDYDLLEICAAIAAMAFVVHLFMTCVFFAWHHADIVRVAEQLGEGRQE